MLSARCPACLEGCTLHQGCCREESQMWLRCQRWFPAALESCCCWQGQWQQRSALGQAALPLCTCSCCTSLSGFGAPADTCSFQRRFFLILGIPASAHGYPGFSLHRLFIQLSNELRQGFSLQNTKWFCSCPVGAHSLCWGQAHH